MGFDLAWLWSQVPDRRIGWHTTIDSTMTEAIRLAGQGAPSGTVVGAEEQTAGQGRHGRAWHSEPGSGLYVSIILRRQLTPATLPVVTLALGLAMREAILKATDLACDLRWPNDVLIESEEMRRHPHHARSLSYHCRHRHQRESFVIPGGTDHIATSLRIASGRIAIARAVAGGSYWRASTPIAICSKPRAADQLSKPLRAHPATFPAGAFRGSRRLCAAWNHGRARPIPAS